MPKYKRKLNKNIDKAFNFRILKENQGLNLL
jgi:hypothetical protein